MPSKQVGVNQYASIQVRSVVELELKPGCPELYYVLHLENIPPHSATPGDTNKRIWRIIFKKAPYGRKILRAFICINGLVDVSEVKVLDVNLPHNRGWLTRFEEISNDTKFSRHWAFEHGEQEGFKGHERANDGRAWAYHWMINWNE